MANTLKFGDGKWATGEGTALAFNDENENFKPLPFTFTRNSTATVVNQSGLIEEVGNDVPRIDFKDNTKGALLLEPTRTNSITYSEDFSQSYWNKSNGVIISSNSTTSIDGTLNATKITGANAYGSIFIPSTTVLSGVKYTYSVFVKKNISSKVSLRAMTTGNDTRVIFNLDDLSTNISEGYDTGYDSSSIEVYSNGWYKCILTVTTATTSLRLNIYPDSPNNVSSQSGVYIYGAQVEQGSYATSYIPTSGSAVTRVADSNIQQNIPNSVVGQTEGTVYVNLSWTEISTNIYYVFSDGTSSNRILIYSTSESGIFILIQSGGATSASFSITSQDARVLNKIAISYKNNDFKVAINGEIKGTDTSGNIPVGINFTEFLIYGKIEENKIYNTALTDAELITLTT